MTDSDPRRTAPARLPTESPLPDAFIPDPGRFFELSAARFCVLRPDGCISWVSPNWKLEGMVGSWAWEWVHPSDAIALRAAVGRAAIGAPADLVVTRWRCGGDGWRWLQVRAAPSRDGASVYCSLIDVSDDIVRRQSLARQNELLPLAENVGRFGHWHYDLIGDSVTWSDGVYRIYGVDRESFVPSYEKAVGFFHPEDRETVETAVRRAVATQSRFTFERRLCRADGSEVTVLCIGLCEVRNGQAVALSGILQDITVAKQAEADLRRTRESLNDANRLISQIMAGAHRHIVAVDEAIRITACNEPYRAMFLRVAGRSVDVGDSIPEALAAFPDQRKRVEANYRRAFAGEQFIDVVEYSADQGEPVVVEVHLGPIHNSEGKVIGACAVMHDVTERRRMERELEASEKRFRDLITGSLQAVVIHCDFKPVFANERYAQMFGFDSVEDVLEMPSLLALLPEEDRHKYIARNKALLDGSAESFKGRFPQRRKDGAVVWVDYISTRVVWKGRSATQVIFIDVTERVRYAEQLEAERTRYREEAITDALTGAFNRRHFMEMAERELPHGQRLGRPAAIVMFDIDHFKAVNDRFGHDVGDVVLRGIAEAAQRALRDVDTLGRWGGEEFVVLLPETDLDAAAAVAERLRETFAALRFDGNGTSFSVTASFGVAVSSERAATVDLLLSQVDDALYRAKGAGRNCVASGAD